MRTADTDEDIDSQNVKGMSMIKAKPPDDGAEGHVLRPEADAEDTYPPSAAAGQYRPQSAISVATPGPLELRNTDQLCPAMAAARQRHGSSRARSYAMASV
jgi:hypothetical protein